ncbi:mechanosensitive ion channel family protein [Sulfurimonas sp.]|jgi:MscS family membrane protein|uniref:mechanosensitive ion channel family protein n=1 Tax=Sulfurimonas sp. TaxID=2022749 RepID=UPI002600D2B0|nr:mechanosensitive ion channel family protein [Sulfurimonas sp.]MBT5934264.1 mechanosensitive ion channel family protein [Sulfurimonas sp.]
MKFNTKHFLCILVIFSTVFLHAEVKYSEFIDSQILIAESMNDLNTSEKELTKLVEKQEEIFHNTLNKLMINKNNYIRNLSNFERKIIALKKVIAINKRAGNRYAILRDEIVLKSYSLIRNQNTMIRNVLVSLDETTIEKYRERLNEHITTNKVAMQEFYDADYSYLLKQEDESKIFTAVKKNIEEFQVIKDINADVISYLYTYEGAMYRLNKYSKYYLASFVVFVNTVPIVEVINPFLEIYGLNIIKISIILVLIVMIYLFRRAFNIVLERYIPKINIFKEYSHEVIKSIQVTIDKLMIVINIHMIINVYNNFSSLGSVERIFNIIYGFVFTLLIYKVINTVAVIKLKQASYGNGSIKNDLVNIGIKIVNFVIIILGLLIMLFFAGVNLTAVLSGLGIGGFAVAFAAKDTISNFFGTLSILFSDVFSQGDWIAVDGHEGVVVEIGLRVTTMRTFDNALIAIPNGTFASKDVKNWNKRILGRRIKMSIGVKYDSKSQDIKNTVLQIREMLDKHPGIATKNTKYQHINSDAHMAKLVSKDDLEGVKNTLLVFLDEFSDSSINILVYCFTKSVMWEDWLIVKEDVMHKLMAILEQNSLEFAFPSLSIYNETQVNN